MTRIILAALCSVSLTAVAEPEAATSTTSTEASGRPTASDMPRFGLLVDAGFPDLLGLNAVFRPVHFLRVNAGLMHNGASPGVRAGVSLIPFYFAVTPTLSFEYGHFFGGDANRVLNGFGVDTGKLEPLLRDVAYDFYSGHLGVEVGSARRLAVFFRLGLSHFVTRAAGSGEFIQRLADDPTLEMSDFRIRATLPSVKLGFVLYLG